ncbi:MAG: TMEM175 family protein, partial [Pseudolabrys sp.]
MEGKTMGTQRLEAFTDGVIAIVITIMVLEIKVPHGATPEALLASLPILLTYVLSFVNVGLFWNNHHHMLHATSRVDGKVLWANMFLLFWI